MAKPPKYTDEELVKRALEILKAQPLLSEIALCGKLGVGREYIADRAKSSDAVDELRDLMFGIRQAAWEEEGIRGMKSRAFNATTYIWMTRNILGWRDERAESNDDNGGGGGASVSVAMSPEQLVELVKKAREGK